MPWFRRAKDEPTRHPFDYVPPERNTLARKRRQNGVRFTDLVFVIILIILAIWLVINLVVSAPAELTY